MAAQAKRKNKAKAWWIRGVCLALALLLVGMMLASALWSN